MSEIDQANITYTLLNLKGSLKDPFQRKLTLIIKQHDSIEDVTKFIIKFTCVDSLLLQFSIIVAAKMGTLKSHENLH